MGIKSSIIRIDMEATSLNPFSSRKAPLNKQTTGPLEDEGVKASNDVFYRSQVKEALALRDEIIGFDLPKWPERLIVHGGLATCSQGLLSVAREIVLSRFIAYFHRRG